MESLPNNGKYNPPVNGTDGREAYSKFWIAAYTRPKSEKKAASEIANNLHLPTYAPTQILIRQWSDRKKKIEAIIIPMIIFVEVSSDDEILEVKKHPLINSVLTLPGRKDTAHIPTKQIDMLKFMLSESNEPVEFVQGPFKVSDQVRVVRGNLVGLEGVVQRASDGQTYIVIAIDLLGGAKVTVKHSDIEAVHRQ